MYRTKQINDLANYTAQLRSTQCDNRNLIKKNRRATRRIQLERNRG